MLQTKTMNVICLTASAAEEMARAKYPKAASIEVKRVGPSWDDDQLEIARCLGRPLDESKAASEYDIKIRF